MKEYRGRLHDISLSGCLLAVCLASVGATEIAVAAPATRREADRHFDHGVALYMEADYRGALVEFLRAYEIAPNSVVLFNIGETQYQLRDYAAALATFERYLVETPRTDSRRTLVEANVKELRTRVGRLTITTFPVGAEISVDDRVIGKTPFDRPVVVGIGHLNVRAYLAGHLPISHVVDVAAEDNLSVTLELPPSGVGPRGEGLVITSAVEPGPRAPVDRAAWRRAGWIAAGVLAAGSIGVGFWARDESQALSDARDSFAAQPSTLRHLSSKTVVLSVIADSLGAAALALGGITLYASMNAKETTPSTRLSAGVGSMTFEMKF
jgi:tetratricopeptide (TPR) repeat protein